MTDPRLTEKVVVITGASKGFGKAAAIALARAGASVVLAARRNDLLEEIVETCALAGRRAMAVPTDVGDENEVAELARETVSVFGRIDVWINNPASRPGGRFEEVPLEEHVRAVESALLGTIYGSYVALRQFRKQGFGTLINLAWVSGPAAGARGSANAAAACGIVGLSAALRCELEENGVAGIRICTVRPESPDGPGLRTEELIDAVLGLAREPQDEVALAARPAAVAAGSVGANP